KPVDEAKAVTACYGERAPVVREIPKESARNGENLKIQTRLSGTTRHPALSGLVVQTFPRCLRLLAHSELDAPCLGNFSENCGE
ncbi:hypothetical protein NY751_12125, partial [Xanthomonas campestris]|uniref:hypothetical protein n=1 Tax=Xanthomonas campestris TaxID=339 RepID=UPI00235A2A5A